MTDPSRSPLLPREDQESVEDKLVSSVKCLLESAASLRQALVKRDASAVWDLLAQQEEQALLFEQYIRLLQQLSPEARSPEQQQRRGELARGIRKLQVVQQSNAALAQSFLSAVRRAMSSVGAGAEPERNVYTRQGRAGLSAKSVLIRRFG